MKKSISEYVSKRIGKIDQRTIIEFGNEPDNLQVFNVVRGLEKEAYSVQYNNKDDYDLIYISNREKLIGFYLKSGLNIQQRTTCTAAFCQMLHEAFDEIDEIDAFNTYQKLLRAVLEKDGFFTLSDQEYSSMKGENVVFKGGKGVVLIPFIRKIELYNSIFSGRTFKDSPEQNKIYLMLNPDTNRIKIGHSKKTSYREGTLQSKEPNIKLICSWIAPKNVETELHKKYESKRKRGEWFNLNPRDLKEINDLMKKYKKIEYCS